MSATETLTESSNDTTVGFHQSWFPIALANELGTGAVIGRDFLGTRVILYRDPAGKALVQSAYCPHLGADLSVGQLVDGQIRCAYHHWRLRQSLEGAVLTPQVQSLRNSSRSRAPSGLSARLRDRARHGGTLQGG